MSKVWVVIREESRSGILGVWVFDTEAKAEAQLTVLFENDKSDYVPDFVAPEANWYPKSNTECASYWIIDRAEGSIYEREVTS